MTLLFADMVRLTHRRRSDIIFLMFDGSGGRGAAEAPGPHAPPPTPAPSYDLHYWMKEALHHGMNVVKCYSFLWAGSV